MSFTHGHALLIGIGSYVHLPQLNVPITAADAQAVAAVLHNPAFCGYPPNQVMLLADAAATRDAILATFDELGRRASVDDTVLVFYAGHGEYGEDGYYLTTHDTRLANRKVMSNTGLHETELIAKLRAIKAKRLLLIVNACHSGQLSPVLDADEEPLTGTPLPTQVSTALLDTGEGRVIINACRETQYAFIGPGPLTLFTQALVDGLQGKGIRSNHGYISVFDLYIHLYFTLDEAVPHKIPAAVRQRYCEKQEPELTILKGIGPFAIALYRGTGTLDSFDNTGKPPEGMAVRTISPTPSRLRIFVYPGNTEAPILETSERLITIGRAPKNHLCLHDTSVSWEHGQLTLMRGSYYYRHLSTTNPTILRRRGEERLLRPGLSEEIELRDQDRLTIGKNTIVVSFDLVSEDMEYKTTEREQWDDER